MQQKSKSNPRTEKHDPYAAVRVGEFRVFLASRVFMTLAYQMVDIIVYQQVYEITKKPLLIGFIGLAEAVPMILVALYAGHVADRRNRRNIILLFNCIVLVATLALFAVTIDKSSFITHEGLISIYALVFIMGVARGFLGPAIFGLMGQVVARELYPSASTWNSTIWHTAAVIGPALGGLCYARFEAGPSYGIAGFFLFVSIIMMYIMIKPKPLPKFEAGETLSQSLLSGIKFVFAQQIILGALTLDLFAVLFGGVIALLPFFANDILHVNATGLGLLKAAPAFGAVLMAFVLVYIPQKKHAGRNLMLCVIGFGLCMIFFAWSTNFFLSIALLMLSGMFDNVSVVIRSTILQLKTPDNMRGRVSAVNNIFIGSSNEIGAFESGLAAKIMGIIPSVVFGGVMTVIVVGITSFKAPKLRKLDLSNVTEES
jgi:MFS family permease